MRHAAWLLGAWVLWSQSQDITPGDHRPPSDWTVGGGFTTVEKCEESVLRQLYEIESRPRPYVKSTIVEGFTVKVQMKTGTVLQVTSVCLPDTVDPRARR